MFTFIAGIFTGAVGTILVMGLVSAGKPTESDVQVERKHADIWKREAKQWETASIRLHDELRSATRMAQYWRARCMNAHCDFTAACDGEGNYPTDNDAPTREEKLVSDIMDAVAVVDKKDEAIPA
jgi:hypothetical protein